MAGRTQGPPARGSRTPSSRSGRQTPASAGAKKSATPSAARKKPEPATSSQSGRAKTTAASTAGKPASARPVPKKPGPKGPNFAARRILGLVLIAGVIVLAVWGGIKLFSFVWSTVADRVAADSAPSEEPTDGPFLGQPTTCEMDVVDWAFSVNADTAGSRVTVPYTVTNNGEIPCLIDGGASSLVLTVTSGDDRIWSNADCSSNELKLLLGAGDSTERTLVWGGERSVPGCGSVDSPPQPGTYKLVVSYDDYEIPHGVQVFDLK